MSASFLTDGQVRVLREVIEEHQRRPRNTTNRPSLTTESEQTAPEVYLAMTPPNGIPGAVYGLGTGSGSTIFDADQPGSADCNVYRILADPVTFLPEMQEVSGLKRTVLNFSQSPIAGRQLAVIARDKWGSWFVISAPQAETGWVKILCKEVGQRGYPGLVQLRDVNAFTYGDEDGRSFSVPVNVSSGEQEVHLSSVDGIDVGSVLLVIDGLCGSEAVTVTDVDKELGTGTDADLPSITAEFVNNNVAYAVVNATITSGGSGYGNVPPNVTFSGGSGTGATGVAILDPTGDFVIAIFMTNNGSEYNPTPPTITIDPPGGSGTTATAEVVIGPPIKVYLAGAWIQFNPDTYTPNDVDVGVPIVFPARHEENADDGLPVWLAIGGRSFNFSCPSNAETGKVYAGRIQDYTPPA